MATFGLVMRVRNAAGSLPQVLAAVAAQHRQADRFIAIDNGSTDVSRDLVQRAGADLLTWDRPYHPPAVLNHAIGQCPTDLVMLLSAHTVLDDPTAFSRIEAAFAEDPALAGVCHREPEHAIYGDRLDLAMLRERGLTWFSPWSASSGALRRASWEAAPFDDRFHRTEDCAWILDQLAAGRAARLLDLGRRYLRASAPAWHPLNTSRNLHALCHRYGLQLAGHSIGRDARELARGGWWSLRSGFANEARRYAGARAQRLWGRASWRWHDPFRIPVPESAHSARQ